MGGYSVSPTLIYVHGANGSGKSTLARQVIMAAGGVRSMAPWGPHQTIVTFTRGSDRKGPIALVGKYSTPTGGADSVQPYAHVPATALALLREGYNVLVEGLITPGVDTCKAINAQATKYQTDALVEFVLLDVDIDTCTRHVLERRTRKGNAKTYDNSHLVKKHRSASNWIDNLKAAGLTARRMPWRNARDHVFKVFAINADGATAVLDLGAPQHPAPARKRRTAAVDR